MPSFYTVTTGSVDAAQDLNQLVNALNGASGQGVPIAITGPNDSVNFALAVKNNETVNSRALQVLRANNAVLIQADVNGVVISPDGVAAAAQVVNLSLAQTLTNKSSSYVSGQGNTLTVPACRVYNSINLNLTTGTLTALTFDTERYKTDAGMHSTSTNTGRLVATVAGKYRITGHVVIAASAGGTYRYAQLRVNGATVIGGQSNPSLGASVSPLLTVSATYALALNDYVELLAQQDSGGTIVATAIAAYGNEFEMEYVGA